MMKTFSDGRIVSPIITPRSTTLANITKERARLQLRFAAAKAGFVVKEKLCKTTVLTRPETAV